MTYQEFLSKFNLEASLENDRKYDEYLHSLGQARNLSDGLSEWLEAMRRKE